MEKPPLQWSCLPPEKLLRIRTLPDAAPWRAAGIVTMLFTFWVNWGSFFPATQVAKRAGLRVRLPHTTSGRAAHAQPRSKRGRLFDIEPRESKSRLRPVCARCGPVRPARCLWTGPRSRSSTAGPPPQPAFQAGNPIRCAGLVLFPPTVGPMREYGPAHCTQPPSGIPTRRSS